MRDTAVLIDELKNLNINMNNNQIDQLLQYYDILIEKNKVMNLTAITEYEEFIYKHFIDSLSLVRVCNLNNSMSIIDVGTGAGFPGIPLKIAYPNLNIVLLDSLNKRIQFLNEAIQELNLNNIEAVHGRAEDFGKNTLYREQYDICVSRAVANLSVLSEYCIPFIKKDGYFISYKSSNIQEELESSKKAIHVLGGVIHKVDQFQLPGTDIERSLVMIKKVANTPKKYPRTSGKPSKEPI